MPAKIFFFLIIILLLAFFAIKFPIIYVEQPTKHHEDEIKQDESPNYPIKKEPGLNQVIKKEPEKATVPLNLNIEQLIVEENQKNEIIPGTPAEPETGTFPVPRGKDESKVNLSGKIFLPEGDEAEEIDTKIDGAEVNIEIKFQ